MENKFVKNLLVPVLHRLGTAAAVWLVSQGVESDLANQLATGLIAAALVAFDLAGDAVTRKTGAKQ